MLHAMSAQFSMLEIINAALLAQGQYTVAENEASNEWALCSQNWPLIVMAELEDGAYEFSKVQHFLQSRIGGKYGYADGFAIPQTALFVRQVWTEETTGDRTLISWTQDGENVYVDEPSGVYVETVEAVGTDIWSANFCLGVRFKMEALICRGLKEEAGEAVRLEGQAEVHFERARTKASKSRSATEPFQKGRLTAARFGRG